MTFVQCRRGKGFFRKDYLISLYSFSGLCCLEACNIRKKKKKKEMLCVPFLYGTRIQFATGLIPWMRNKVIMNLEGNSELTFLLLENMLCIILDMC